MKNRPFILNLLLIRFHAVLILAGLLVPIFSFSQATDFYNSGAVISIDPTTILYVGGNISNTVAGTIHNAGDIYLTGDWTNDEPSGCLDPNTGSVILYGTSLQHIKGLQPTKFNNLDCQTASTKELDIDTYIGGTSGSLSLHSSPFDLNKNTCIITNPIPAAITNTTGYIISETDPTGYGKIQWNLGTTINSYTIPFGTIGGTYIPCFLNVTSPGTPSGTGSISVATYPTSVTATPNNRPLPAGVSDLNDAIGNESAAECLDRYWITNAANFSVNPTSDFTLTYRDSEWDATGGSTNNIMEDSLQGWMWNGTQWQNPTVGTLNSAANTVAITGINTYSVWTLKLRQPPPPFECGELAVPNAFSPNNDGHNDLFILHGWSTCVSNFSFLVFDRWGEKVFETEDPSKGWDGIYKGRSLEAGVYVYYINANSSTGKKVEKRGNISLIR